MFADYFSSRGWKFNFSLLYVTTANVTLKLCNLRVNAGRRMLLATNSSLLALHVVQCLCDLVYIAVVCKQYLDVVLLSGAV
jgi:hypothetical protein